MPPVPPNIFYGTVTYEGEPAQSGYISIYGADGRYLTSGLVTAGTYGQSSPCRVKGDDPGTTTVEGATAGEQLDFYLRRPDGVKIRAKGTHPVFRVAKSTRFDVVTP